MSGTMDAVGMSMRHKPAPSVVRRPTGGAAVARPPVKLSMESRRAAIPATVDAIVHAAKDAQLSKSQQENLAIALSEALANAAIHGNRLRPGARVAITVKVHPGDRVVIRDAVLYVDDRPVEEPYVDLPSIDGLYTPTTFVPEDSVFVLGDNRALSIDSRELGPVALDEVEGRVVVRLWPLGCADPAQPCD